MQQRILVWIAGLTGGIIVLSLFSFFVVSRTAVRQRGDPPIGPPPADTAPVAGLPGTNPVALPPDTAPTDTAPASAAVDDQSQVVSNEGPLDSALIALSAGQRQRTALDIVLRKGIVYQVKETTPNVIRYVVGAPFFAEPTKYRNPLIRDLYHAYTAGRPAKPALYFEFWGLRTKLGEYVADTFYLGPRYAKPR
jgi:hypothetical protein